MGVKVIGRTLLARTLFGAILTVIKTWLASGSARTISQLTNFLTKQD